MKNGNVLQIPLPEKRRRPNNFFRNFLLIVILVVLVVVLSKQFVISTIAQVQMLPQDSINRTITLDGVLIKTEKVFKAPCSGRFHLIRPEGERLEMGAGGAKIITIDADGGETTTDMYTDVTGILCSHLDGYESILTPANMDELAPPVIGKINDRPLADGDLVDKGQPVFKIIDNLSPVYMYTTIPKADFAAGFWDEPGILQVSWNNFDFSIIPGAQLVDNGENIEGLFLLKNFPEQIIHRRQVSIDVTAGALGGLLVPEQAVVYRDEQPGIYLVIKKKATWTPVEIKGSLGGKVALGGDEIVEGVPFVSNPILMREGWLIE
ncbi:MAG: hypothetical protein GX325_02710 [Peptococcaceae bacterium]|nr:hypothetical protein [Peptococcaceae bacterium]